MHQHALSKRICAATAACVALAGALSCGVAVNGMASADDTAVIYSSVEASDGARNYAINLVEGATEADMDAALQVALDMGDVVALSQYQNISTFFVQALSKSFAQDYAAAATQAGVKLVSVGVTRQTKVAASENLLEPQGRSAYAVETLSENSQFAKEDALQTDPYTTVDYAWGVLAIGADKAAEVVANDIQLADVTVGVVDSGIDADHEDLKTQINHEKSVGCANNGIPNTKKAAWQPTTSDHGTHVAGTIAAAANGVGVDGVAPQAELASIKVVNDAGSIYPEYVACGFEWAVDHDIDVTNNSYYVDPWEFWVPTDPDQAAGYEAVRRVTAYAVAKGVTTIVAAGNSNYDLDNPTTDSGSPNDVSGRAEQDDGKTAIRNRDVTNGVNMPAQLDGVAAVSSVAKTTADALSPLTRSGFSNYGVNNIDVAAPGSSIVSTVPGGYGYKSGTSMASPHAAGVAALIKGVHPDYTPEQTIALLKEQASTTFGNLVEPTDGKEYRGAGLVNAYAAVTQDQPTPMIHAAEYSTDGGANWKALEGARLTGKAQIRVTATGSVSELQVTLDGQQQVAKADNLVSGANNTLVTTLNVDYSKAEKDESRTIAIAAYGMNANAEADDDASASAAFSFGPKTDPDPKPKEIAATGSSVMVFAAVALALVASAVAMLGARSRQTR